MIDAAISPGSSGGVLLNASGQVIGVTSAMAAGAQNINLARPINLIETLKGDDLMTLRSILPDTVYYDKLFPAPDFGAYADIGAYKTEISPYRVYYYKNEDFENTTQDAAMSGYQKLLEDNTFEYYGFAIEESNIILYYLNGSYNLLVKIGQTVKDDVSCVRVEIIEIAY
jgi:hypothetical protein